MTVFESLSSLLNEHQLRAFLACYEGTDVRFKKRAAGAFFVQLARVVGDDAARRLCERFAGERVYVPFRAATARKDIEAQVMSRVYAGDPHVTIARTFRISEREVRRIRAHYGEGRPAHRPRGKVAA